MKIVGLLNHLGFNPLRGNNHPWPLALSVIYQSEDGKHLIKYLDSGDIPLLLSKYESMKDITKRDAELEKFLNCGTSIEGYPHQYSPIKNEYYYKYLDLENEEFSIDYYCRLADFPQDKVMIEPNYKTDLQTYNSAVMFSNRQLYVGSNEFIYQNAFHNLSIKEKEVNEIEGIIYWLIQSMYLDEALAIINKIKSSGINLNKYKHHKNLVVFDGSDNFLDEQLNRIESINYVKEKTKTLKLHLFER